MKIFSRIIGLVALGIFLWSGSAFATNITIYDGMGTGVGWHGAQEDQEVEPGCVGLQEWDLEGFYLNGSILKMVGGFDFINGYQGVSSGDIFIDINNNAKYGPSNTGDGFNNGIVTNTFGYDYVIDLDFALENMSYSVYELNEDSSTVLVDYSLNQESNPWRYNDGGTKLEGYDGNIGHMTWEDPLGDRHNEVSVEIGFLGDLGYKDFIIHSTIECGNDNLMGSTAPVPEPATMFLLGAGLMGIGIVGRKKFRK